MDGHESSLPIYSSPCVSSEFSALPSYPPLPDQLFGEVEPSSAVAMEIQNTMTSLQGAAVEDCEQSVYRHMHARRELPAIPVTHRAITPSVLPVYNTYSELVPEPKPKSQSRFSRAISSIGSLFKRSSKRIKEEEIPSVEFFRFPSASSIAPSGYETYPARRDPISEEVVFPTIPEGFLREANLDDAVGRSDEDHPVWTVGCNDV